jgi:hypothetical protein
MIYAQALHLFNEGFRYWFDQEEIKAISDNNEQYQLRSPEEELLLTWFEPATKETANIFLNASQIASKLAEKAKINTLKHADLNTAKQKMLEARLAYIAHYKENPESLLKNAVFGEMNRYEWYLLERKHVNHHFEQFGILD